MLIGSEKNPKGPSFSNSRKIDKNLSGNKLSFLAPPCSAPFSNSTPWEEEPDSTDIFNLSHYQPIQRLSKETSEIFKSQDINTLRIYSNSWEFRGRPLLEGYCGHVNLLININSVDDLPINETLFDNNILTKEVYRELEFTKLQDLHKGHSDDPMGFTNYAWPTYLAPINCHWLQQGGCDWLYLESQPLLDNLETVTFYTAIDEKLYLSFQFVIVRSARNAGNPYQIDKRVPRDNFLSLIQRIMNSVNLELNAEAKCHRSQTQSHPGANKKPVISCTPDQLKDAKHVLYMWSARGFEQPGKGKDDDHRADPKDVAAFIEERIKPRPLPNSYPPGEVLSLESQASAAEAQTS